ncbi:MAG: redoxin domain-containing protein [Phycisphaerales bacterium]|nr:redoxin domain-containing protein [Phycisphaerales bacterium]
MNAQPGSVVSARVKTNSSAVGAAAALAPDVTVFDPKGKATKLSKIITRPTVLFIYPEASSPACTEEAKGFSASKNELSALGFDVMGLSPDEPEAIACFIDDESLKIPMYCDPRDEKGVPRGLQALGAYGQKSLYGKTVTAVLRSTLILEPSSKGPVVRLAMINIRAKGHVERVVQMLRDERVGNGESAGAKKAKTPTKSKPKASGAKPAKTSASEKTKPAK